MDTINLLFGADPKIGITPIEPRPLVTPYSQANFVEGKSYIAHNWRRKRVLMEQGYVIQPNDCPPIRNLNSYGFEFFASANSKVQRNTSRLRRCTTESSASNALYTHTGDRCAKSDSGFFTSWLGNSDYFKIITGLLVYCPVGYGLYQGGSPYQVDLQFVPLAAIEYGNSNGIVEISKEKHFVVEMNLVCSFQTGEIEICRGQSLGVFYPVMNSRRFELRKFDEKY